MPTDRTITHRKGFLNKSEQGRETGTNWNEHSTRNGQFLFFFPGLLIEFGE